jgi:uncharacterized membrane protein
VVRWATPVRLGGLALLALATTKVFLYDLASLDATYKVASFIGLGVLLLVSSYAYQRLKPQLARQDGPALPPSGSGAEQHDPDTAAVDPSGATASP